MYSTPPPPRATSSAAGWHPDPWGMASWRWWDGQRWTTHVAINSEKKPVLPAWLSIPVLIFGVLAGLLVLGFAVQVPLSIPLGLVPLVIVAPVLHWLDRVEPEPWSARIHALLWGATVAVVISGVLNSIVSAVASPTYAAVLSAPIVEEGCKAIGILYAVRRKELDGVMDGIIYAGWTALGFAIVEDFLYFAQADQGGILLEVFILRALLTPFAHPLFTSWTGLAIGRAVAKGKPVFPRLLWGYALAVGAHMAWNGSLAIGEREGGQPVLLLSILLFVGLFIAGVVMLGLTRKREQRRFIELVPWLAQRYGLAQQEVSLFGSWKTMLAARRRLPKRERRQFDGVHAALARLAHLHDQPGETNPATEQILAARLQKARSQSAS